MSDLFSQELLAPPQPQAFVPFWKSEAGAVFNKPLVDLNVEVVEAKKVGQTLYRVSETGLDTKETSRALGCFYGDAYFNGLHVPGGVWGYPEMELKKPVPRLVNTQNSPEISALPYLYAWLSVSKFALSCLVFKYPKFRLTRDVDFKQSKVTVDLDLRDQETLDAITANPIDGEAIWAKMQPIDLGLQASGNDFQESNTWTYIPRFANVPEVDGVFSVGENVSTQKWLAWAPPEIASTGEVIPDIQARVNDLFPYPENPTQEQIDRVDLERDWAFRYATRFNWETQFRAFDPPVLRQAEIINYRAPRQPAWRIPMEYACDAGNPRLAVDCYGDQPAMAWHDLAGTGDVSVLMRIRPEIGFPVPKFTLADFGLPSDFWNGVLVNPIAPLNPELIPVPEMMFGGTFNRVEILHYAADQYSPTRPYFLFGERTVQNRGWETTLIDRKFLNWEGSNFPYTPSTTVSFSPTWSPVGPKFVGSGYQPGKVFGVDETPDGLAWAFDCAANWGTVAFSAEQCVQFAPPLVGLNGLFYVLDNEAQNGFTTVRWYVRLKKTHPEGEAMQYTLCNLEVTKDGQPTTDYDEPLSALATWFNDYFLNEAKYTLVGFLQWKHPGGQLMAKQELYGHEDFFNSFSLTVDCLES